MAGETRTVVSRWAWGCIAVIGISLAVALAGWFWLLEKWSAGPINQVLSFLGGAVLLILVPRYLHLLRVAAESAMGVGSQGVGYFDAPLPSQRKVVDALTRASAGRSDLAPNIIALRGEWGTGKTACMHLYEHEMAQAARVPGQRRAATVWFDCWRHQADTLPEMSLFWQVASSYALLWPLGWLFVPALRLYISRIPLVLKAEWKLGGGTIAFDSNSFKELPKALFWQHRLEILVRGALRSGFHRVVIVLEDIDRCAPQAAQVYVTLIRRFLAVPGVSVLVPYVDQQLSAKVFNPIGRQLPDLAATTQALLWREFRHKILEEDGQQSSLVNTVFTKVQDRLLADGSMNPTGTESWPHSPPDVVQAWLWTQMSREYLLASPAVSRRIDNLLSDKYLSDTIEVVPWLSSEDCVELVRRRLSENSALTSAIDVPDQALVWLQRKLQEARFGSPAQLPRVSARQFNVVLEQVFNGVTEAQITELIQKWSRAVGDDQVDPALQLLWWMVHLAFGYAADRTCGHQMREDAK